MSKCSKKCNKIKQKIDSISGLDDDYVYNLLNRLDILVDTVIVNIEIYEKQSKLNGTCFKQRSELIE